jgi:hypothetical protein
LEADAVDKDSTQGKPTGADQPIVELRAKSTDGRGRVVHMQRDEYEKLMRGETIVKRIEDFTDEEVEAIMNAPMHPDCYLYNDEVE